MGNIVKFAKPYSFEGTEYTEVDLSGMDKLTIQDMIDIQKKLAGEIATLAAVEATTSFAQEVATKASGKPVEFFKLMPRAKIKQVQTAILNLSGVGELNTMSESMAENRMVAGGFSPVNTGRNYLYVCIIASMGTGYPEDFFTGLPLCEAAKLRDAVDADFFE